jgi:hypothetical protein
VKGIRKKEDPYNASTFSKSRTVLLLLAQMSPWVAVADRYTVIAGFFTGGALAVRGGLKAARNSAIGCACLLAVIEGVGIGFQRMMAENTRLDVRKPNLRRQADSTDTYAPSYHHHPRRHQKVEDEYQRWHSQSFFGAVLPYSVLTSQLFFRHCQNGRTVYFPHLGQALYVVLHSWKRKVYSRSIMEIQR